MTTLLRFLRRFRSAKAALFFLCTITAATAQTTLFDFTAVNVVPGPGLTEIAPGQFVGVGLHYLGVGGGAPKELVLYKLAEPGVYTQLYDFGNTNCLASY